MEEIDIHKAINARLEMLHLMKKIEELEEIIDKNVTKYQFDNRDYVSVDKDKIEASIMKEDYVGHQLIYKDIEVNLHTERHGEKVNNKIFENVFKGYRG